MRVKTVSECYTLKMKIVVFKAIDLLQIFPKMHQNLFERLEFARGVSRIFLSRVTLMSVYFINIFSREQKYSRSLVSYRLEFLYIDYDVEICSQKCRAKDFSHVTFVAYLE